MLSVEIRKWRWLFARVRTLCSTAHSMLFAQFAPENLLFSTVWSFVHALQKLSKQMHHWRQATVVCWWSLNCRLRDIDSWQVESLFAALLLVRVCVIRRRNCAPENLSPAQTFQLETQRLLPWWSEGWRVSTEMTCTILVETCSRMPELHKVCVLGSPKGQLRRNGEALPTWTLGIELSSWRHLVINVLVKLGSCDIFLAVHASNRASMVSAPQVQCTVFSFHSWGALCVKSKQNITMMAVHHGQVILGSQNRFLWPQWKICRSIKTAHCKDTNQFVVQQTVDHKQRDIIGQEMIKADLPWIELGHFPATDALTTMNYTPKKSAYPASHLLVIGWKERQLVVALLVAGSIDASCLAEKCLKYNV